MFCYSKSGGVADHVKTSCRPSSTWKWLQPSSMREQVAATESGKVAASRAAGRWVEVRVAWRQVRGASEALRLVLSLQQQKGTTRAKTKLTECWPTFATKLQGFYCLADGHLQVGHVVRGYVCHQHEHVHEYAKTESLSIFTLVSK